MKDAAAEPSTADPIRFTLRFSEDAKGSWDDPLVGRLTRQKVLQVDDKELNHVVLRVTGTNTAGNIEQDWEFLNLSGQKLTSVAESAVGVVQSEVAFFSLAALREAARHFDAKGPYWRTFLKDSDLPAEKRDEIEAKLREVNDLVVGSHTSLGQAKSHLQKVQPRSRKQISEQSMLGGARTGPPLLIFLRMS